MLKSPFKNIPLPELTGEKFLRMIFGLYKWSGNEVAAETGYRNFILINKNGVTRRITSSQLSLEDIIKVTTGKSIQQLSVFQKQMLKKWYDNKALYPFRFILRDDTSVISNLYTFTLYQPHDTIESSVQLPGNFIEQQDAYWVAGFNGLYKINKKDFKEEIYKHEKNNKWSLSESNLYHLTIDKNNNFWIGSKGGGLNFFDPSKKQFTHFTMADGLPDNVVYCIIPDHNNNLWLTTNKGISRFNIPTKTVTNFSKRDGLLNAEFNRQGGVQMDDGTIFLSGTSGIDYFNPADLPVTVTLPVVHFSELKINNAELTGFEKSTLRHNQNNISLSYTANDFIRPDLVYYRYRLNQNEIWTRVQGLNTVLYNALPAGNYRFEVQASYDNLNWSESAVYSFTINQPWWKSRWFYLALALLTAAALYFIYLYRIRQLKKLYKLRTKISQDLHDEVGATLTSISFLSEVARKQTTETDTPVVKTLDKIGEYSREMIGEINDIVWAVNPANDKFDKITDRMKNFASPQ